jgi:hypothetical protein
MRTTEMRMGSDRGRKKTMIEIENRKEKNRQNR